MPLPGARAIWSETNPKLRIELVNRGLGPALLTSFSAFIDESRHEITTAEEFARLVAAAGVPRANLNSIAPPARIILPDGRLVREIIAKDDDRLFLEVSTHTSANELYESLRRLSFKFEFESVYGEKFKDQLSLEQFGPGTHVTLPPDIVRPVRG